LVDTFPYVTIHAIFLSGICYNSFRLYGKSQPKTFGIDAFYFLSPIFVDWIVIAIIFFIFHLVLPQKGARWFSTSSMICILSVSALYYVVTIKTQTVYGIDFLLDEAVHFIIFYGPSYLNVKTGILMVAGFLFLSTAPHLMLWIFQWRRLFRYTTTAIFIFSFATGLVGWIASTSPVPLSFSNKGPLYLLLSATLRESDYAEETSFGIQKANRLLYATLQPASQTSLSDSLSGIQSVRKVIVYLMEGVADFCYQPESVFIDLFPALSMWHKHAIRFSNYYTLSTLTGHAYQILNIGGYLRSGSRFEILDLSNLSNVHHIRDAGYETAFFSAFDTDYKATRAFFKDCGFTTIMDLDDFGPGYKRFGRVIEDKAPIDAFKKWSLSKSKFYVLINPQDTHHPYWNPDGNVLEKQIINPSFTRYLNALIYQDKILGDLIAFIDKHHPDALLVVTSDHGYREYFPELEQYTDPFKGIAASFEVRFHVPFYFYNKKVFQKKEYTSIPMSHVDTIHTLMDLMGLSSEIRPLTGSSILKRQDRIHFLNTRHNLDIIGLLDGSYKFFHHIQTGANVLFRMNTSSGGWEKADSDTYLQISQHYKDLSIAWYEYLTR